MINRINKITAVIAAMATVAAFTPGVSAAERLETKDGTFTNAVAFEGGKYLFSGYKTDDDDSSLYYNDGEKDAEVEDIDDYDYDELSKYGTQYVTVQDGEDDYLLDLSTGKIDDSEDLETKLDNIASKLKTNLKKADRYGKIDKPVIKEISGNAFGEKWYEYTVTPEAGADGEDEVVGQVVHYGESGTDSTKKCLMGFVNEKGEYIDTTNVANLYAFSKSSQKMVKVQEFNKESDNGGVTAKLDSYVGVVGQDADYIYTLIVATLDGVDEAVGAQGFYIQKISKEAGDKKDGAYVPKSVTSYELGCSYYDNDDLDDATTLFIQGDDDYAPAMASQCAVKDGKLYVTQIKNDGSKVRVTKLNFKKDKVKFIPDGTETKKNADGYFIEKDGDSDQDIAECDAYKNLAADKYFMEIPNGSVSTDVEGNIWALDGGKIYKYDGDEFKEMYTCDRSMNMLDVYDEKNLAAWDSAGDVYTTLQGGEAKADANAGSDDADKEDKPAEGTTAEGGNTDAAGTTTGEGTTGADGTTTTEGQTSAAAGTDGWVKNADGTWSYNKAGVTVKAQWVQDAGFWYYVNADGMMATGWSQVNDKWYYLNASGAMQTGWVQDNGAWYYLNAAGDMATGWVNTDAGWYYLNNSGVMLSNTVVDGYVLGMDGAWLR